MGAKAPHWLGDEASTRNQEQATQHLPEPYRIHAHPHNSAHACSSLQTIFEHVQKLSMGSCGYTPSCEDSGIKQRSGEHFSPLIAHLWSYVDDSIEIN